MTDKSNIADTLRDLAKTCRDGEKGYKEAADHAKSGELKSHFLQISSERGRFASQLESELDSMSKDVSKEEGHAVAALHRAWIDIKEALGGGDHAILGWLEQGDDYAKAKYEKALRENLPEGVMALVRQQSQSILRDHDDIRARRDSYKAA
jgi:uncharacterized protein (TIGR02284 family)